MQQSIIVADDHSMVRKGIKLILKTILTHHSIQEASSCRELMTMLLKKECTHLLLDIIFSDGIALEIIPNIKQLYPDIRIMIFSMQSHEVYGKAFRQYGVNHFLPKSLNEEDTIFYLKKFLSEEDMKPISAGLLFHTNPFSALSPRELEVLHYVLNGHRTLAISDTLNLSMSTISTHKKSIFKKTNTENLSQLIELANTYNISF